MIRVLIFILFVILFAGVATFLASMDGRIETVAFGLRIEVPTGLAIGSFIFVLMIVGFFTAWFKDLAALPGKLKRKEREARRSRGIAALTRGLEAVAVGDASDAQHHARVAQRNLDDAALTRLLTAQAAQLAGDEQIAGENFAAMLEAPETEFLGLRGLYVKAMREGDKETARGYAERAFKLRANAAWAFESVFELGLDRGAWGETRAALATAIKNKIVDAPRGKRGEAALLTADAYAAALSDDRSLALKEAEAALKLAPGLAPAAVLAAECHERGGRRARAARVLEQAFALAPHPALVRAYSNLYKDEEPATRAVNLKKIADRKPTAREAKLAYARRHVLLEEFEQATAILEPLLMERATAVEAALMAEAVAGQYGSDAAKVWLEQAANAPRDPNPGAEGAFHFTRDGWARLVREYMDHERLVPPPLEDAPRGLTMDELKLLAPPPVPDPVEEPEAGTETDGDEAVNASVISQDAPPAADVVSPDAVAPASAPDALSGESATAPAAQDEEESKPAIDPEDAAAAARQVN